ncbi:aldehyde dehydrogenase family protein [Naasia lichenicola]|uniref:aldehyde dehydrogenase family protein n=1 Tax=Naasia lichenicola TaxID=2565933 RepID=UPI00130E95D0|nr:aldehyde dehydrogenase family protein [Naasia lichenicola]
MSTTTQLFIDGEFQNATDARTTPSISPVSGEQIARVAAAGPQDVDRAVAAARRAFTDWSRRSFQERRMVLLGAADGLESDIDRIASKMALETGGTRGWAAMNVEEAAATLREAAGLTSSAIGEVLPSHEPGSTNLSLRVPAGVVLAIVPWNAPLVLAARSVAIALAAGNTVVIRPSELSPTLAGHVLAAALTSAGAPAGVVNVITSAPGEGREVIGQLIAHPHVRRVVFIGSTPVGRQIAQVAGFNLTPAVMELGGKNPTVVLDDADVESTARGLVVGAFANTGQVCMATDRIIATPRIYDALAAAVVRHVGAMIVGDPREPTTDLGPLINIAAARHFSELVKDAHRTGASLLLGDADIDGAYARPVVLEGLGREARLFHEEAFAPIVSLQRAVDDEDAIRMANDTEFGLIASVVSADPAHALHVASRVRSGAVHVNGPSVGDEPHVPFGGIGLSGFGRLGGVESLRTFTEQRTVYLHGTTLGLPLLSD